MKKVLFFIMIIPIMLFAQSTGVKTINANAASIKISGLQAPESVKYYNGKIYISNLGDPNAPNDGFIIQANPDGSKAKKLFEGQLDSPKGFTILNDDWMIIPDQVNNGSKVGSVVLASIKDNKIVTKLVIEGSKFLNDTVKISDSRVAMTDTGASKVYIVDIKGNVLSAKVIANNVVGANGIYLYDNMLYVAGSTFGGDSKGGNIYTMNLDGSKLTKWSDNVIGAGGLDGIAVYNGKLYVSDWGMNGANNKSAIYVFDMKTKKIESKIEGSLSGVADIDIAEGYIWVPELSTSMVKKIQLPK